MTNRSIHFKYIGVLTSRLYCYEGKAYCVNVLLMISCMLVPRQLHVCGEMGRRRESSSTGFWQQEQLKKRYSIVS